MRIKTIRELGQLIRSARRKKNLTQAVFATQVGVSRKWVVDVESGERTSDLSLVLRAMNALGLILDVRERSEQSVSAKMDLNAVISQRAERE